jgi:hypothetical protein
MRNSKPANIISIFAVLSALLAITFCTQPLPPRVDPKIHRAIGAAMATETLSLRKPGAPVYVITRDTTTFSQPALDIQVSAFYKAMAQAKVQIASVQALRLDPLRPLELPSGDLFTLMRKAAPGSVIVSFLGPPTLEEQQKRELGEMKSRFVAFCGGGTAKHAEISRLFDEGLLHAAIVSRAKPAWAGDPAKSQPTFEQLYTAVTSANHSELTTPPSG